MILRVPTAKVLSIFLTLKYLTNLKTPWITFKVFKSDLRDSILDSVLNLYKQNCLTSTWSFLLMSVYWFFYSVLSKDVENDSLSTSTYGLMFVYTLVIVPMFVPSMPVTSDSHNLLTLSHIFLPTPKEANLDFSVSVADFCGTLISDLEYDRKWDIF